MEPEGPKAYRTPEEPVDDRPVVVIRYPFWRDASEALTYMDVAETTKMKRGETNYQYIVRLAELAEQRRKNG